MNKNTPLAAFLAAAFLVGNAFAKLEVDPALPDYKPEGTVAGSVSALVTHAHEPLMASWIVAFQKYHPEATITQTSRKSEIKVYCIAFGPNTEEIYESTFGPYLQKYGYDPFHISVSMGGLNVTVRPQALAIFVHPENPLKKITMAQLDAIYSSTLRGGNAPITKWGDLGLTGEWADKPVHAYARPFNNVATWHFRDAVLRGGEFLPTCIVPGKGTSDEVIAAVEADRYGITYSAYGYKTPKVKANVLNVGAGDGKFGYPNESDVSTGLYPLSRPLELFVNRPPGKPLDPLTKEFLTFILSKQGQALVADDVADGYQPLSAQIAAKYRGKLD